MSRWLSKQSAATSGQNSHANTNMHSIKRWDVKAARHSRFPHPDAVAASFARRGDQPAVPHKAVHQRAPLRHGQLRLQVGPRQTVLRWLYGFLD